MPSVRPTMNEFLNKASKFNFTFHYFFRLAGNYFVILPEFKTRNLNFYFLHKYFSELTKIYKGGFKMNNADTVSTDVIIIGGGPSGLATAIHLADLLKSKGTNQRILLIEKGLSLIHISEPTRLGMISYA